MKFMGSKRRLVKHILPIMLENRKPGQFWVEPFVGGGNMIENVEGNRIGADINKWVIEALTAIRDCPQELPKNNQEFTKEDYQKLRESDDYCFKGYAGFVFSFGAIWMSNWAHNNRNSDYVAEAYRSAQKQSPKLQGVDLICSDYLDLYIPPNSIIYCDPPYKGTAKYKNTHFDHEVFWDWVRVKSKKHTVFVSEYTAPDDFKCLWEKLLVNELNKETDKRIQTERLFIYRFNDGDI